MKAFVAAWIGMAVSTAAFADREERLVPKLGSGALVPVDARESELEALDNRYRLGDEWGKKPVSQADLGSSAAFARAAKATAKVNSATGFYLGYFAGKHVMATNHHVCPAASNCRNISVNFPLLDRTYRAAEFFGTFNDIDLSLFAITVPESDAALLASVAGNFAFDYELYAGQPLITVGFGVANNTFQRLVANRDSDCKVFSGSEDFRFMADPDALNPGPDRVWSFANGCDVSHGDSGSAMVDRDTGEVLGLIWTGKIPKNAVVQDSDYLDSLLDGTALNAEQAIWSELSYAVPAAKIKEYLDASADDANLPAGTRAVYAAMIGE